MAGILVPTPTEADWLAARRLGITASEIAVVLGLSPFDSPFGLYHRKRGDLAGAEDNMFLRVGRHLESLVCELFSELYPEFALVGDGRQLYRHPDRPWQMATPDSLIFDAGRYECSCGATEDAAVVCSCIPDDVPLATFEAKTSATYDDWGDEGTDEIPVHYRCQKLWQIDAMGVEAGYLACLFLPSRKLRVYEIHLDDDARDDLKLMREEAALFMDRLRAGREPDADWRPATGEALKRLHPSLQDTDVTIPRTLAGQYRAACAAVKKAEQRKNLAENRIRARLGDGRRVFAPDGQAVATRQVYDVKEHVRKACTVNKLVPARTAKDSR